jgi:transposase
MYVRKKQNKSGSISIQIIDKSKGQYKVVKTFGSSKEAAKIDYLLRKAHAMIPDLIGQTTLNYQTDNDNKISQYMTNTDSLQIRVIGPELILGSLFDSIGFKRIKDKLFRHLVITRLVYPGSKLKTIDYLKRYRGIELPKDDIYRFLDRLDRKYKSEVEQISFKYSKKVLGNKISIVFYDMTTIYFESEDEDDLRKTGFSKDGKHQNPQIYLGLLVGLNGYPIGYEIFEGNIYEGHTLIPVLTAFEKKFDLSKPIVIADAGLLSNNNIKKLTEAGYTYILGGRVKNESNDIKGAILKLQLKDKELAEVKKDKRTRLIVSYTEKRAKKDRYNRERGLKRLEDKINKGKLSKSHINNRGYNKYLKLSGNIEIKIDYEKFEADNCWDGLKGYITNSKLTPEQVIENYQYLWHIEKAFRISKTDLRIRPIYHRLKERIQAHISISFTAYTIYKELERVLKNHKVAFSARRAIELTQTIYALDYKLPDSEKLYSKIIGLTDEQKVLMKIFNL